MPKYCILVDGQIQRDYLKQLARVGLKINFIETILPAYIVVRCKEKYKRFLYERFAWIKYIQTFDPVPIFWDDWSIEEIENYE